MGPGYPHEHGTWVPPSLDMEPGYSPATDIWWSSLETYSNLSTWGLTYSSDMEWWPLKHVWLVSGRYAFYWNAFLLSFNKSVTLVRYYLQTSRQCQRKISKQHVFTRNVGLFGTSSYRMACTCMHCVYRSYLRLWNDDQGEFSPRETKNNHNSSRIWVEPEASICTMFSYMINNRPATQW